MKASRRYWWRETLVTLAWLLPLMLPYGFGLWWLYANGYALHWLGGVLLLSGLLGLLAALGRRRRVKAISVAGADIDAPGAERRAREGLQALAEEVGAEDVANARAVEALLRRILQVVAEAWNPGRSYAELRFTVPEALALLERLSRRLRVAVREDLPALEHVQLATALQLHGSLRPARKLWTLYRIGRFAVNPVGSLLLELRRGVMQAMTPVLLDTVKETAAALLVREVGECAILLYSGRLRRELESLETDAPEASPEIDPGPLTLLLGGAPNSGKSSLLNALSGRERAVADPLPRDDDLTVYALEHETAGELRILEAPGMQGVPGPDWLRQASRADAVIWVAAAHRADRRGDQEALRAFRSYFEKNTQRRRPPLLLVLTHADRLDPAREWAPPYNDRDGDRPKEQSMRAARQAACAALEIPPDRSALVLCETPADAWNLEEVWARLHAALPAARQTRLERLLTRRSLLEGVQDTAKTLPGLIRQMKARLQA